MLHKTMSRFSPSVDTFVEGLMGFFSEWFDAPGIRGNVVYIYGTSNTCKTSTVQSWAHHTQKTVYRAPQGLADLVGYEGQDIILIDDVSCFWVLLAFSEY